MSISKEQDLKLKIGNFFLASIFALVPTAMTIGFLGVHGYMVCKTLDSRLELGKKVDVTELCNKSNLDTNLDYLIWIWIFTMIPTWRWFYIGHYRRVKKQMSNSD